MKTSNKFLVYSFFSILLITLVVAIALRIPSHVGERFYVMQSEHVVMSGDSMDKQKDSNRAAASFGSATASFSFKGFDEIETSGYWDITIKRGDQYQVKMYADQPTLGGIIVKQYGKVLSLSMRDSNNWSDGFGHGARVRAEITLPNLKKIAASGNSKVAFTGFVSNEVSIGLSGNSYLDSQHNKIAKMQVDSSGDSKISMADDNIVDLEVKTSGSGSLGSRNDKITNLSLGLNGASEADLAGSGVTNASVDLSGASKLQINMLGGELKGSASGASEIIYSGNVSTQEISTNGASSVVKR